MSKAVKTRLATCAAMALAVGGCASISQYIGDPDERWADYKSWTLVTEKPSTGKSLGLGAVHKGPEGYRMVYVNDAGRDTITGEGPYEYPVGTVIVKEQYDDRAAFESGSGMDITVSLKVSDDAANPVDNWQWAASFKAKAKADTFCSSCHSIPFAKDYVFSNVTYLAENEGK